MVPSGAIAGATLTPGRWGPHVPKDGRKLGSYGVVGSAGASGVPGALPGHGSWPLLKEPLQWGPVGGGAPGTRVAKLALAALSSGEILTNQLPNASSLPTSGFAGSKS